MSIFFFRTRFPDRLMTYYASSGLVFVDDYLFKPVASCMLDELRQTDLTTAVKLQANIFMLFVFEHSAIVKFSVYWTDASSKTFVMFLDNCAQVCGAVVDEGLYLLVRRLQRWFRRTARLLRARRGAALAFAMAGHDRLGAGCLAGGLGTDELEMILRRVLRVGG